MDKKQPGFSEILSALPFLTMAEMRVVFEVIKELYPTVGEERKPLPPLADFEARRIQSLIDALERLRGAQA
jgi:hypothetical protein